MILSSLFFVNTVASLSFGFIIYWEYDSVHVNFYYECSFQTLVHGSYLHTLSITSIYHSFLIRDGQCLEYNGEDQAICAVGLAKSKPGVFVEAIQYLLILATPVQVLSCLYHLSPFLLAICEFGVPQI